MKILPYVVIGVAMVSLSFRPTAARSGARAIGSATLQIDVTGVRNGKGVVHVDLCREAEFLKDCPVQASAPAVAGKTTLTISNVQPGSYAVQAFHDENHNGKVDRALFGIPKEGVGFSNDAPIRLGPPKWKDAVFSVSDDKIITFKLRYFLGSGAKN